MKCKHCDGDGVIVDVEYGHAGKYGCKYCDGKGVVEPLTNEEWFDGLSTKEKAKVFANATYSTAETPLTILWGGKEAEQKKWELWLKQPHHDKE